MAAVEGTGAALECKNEQSVIFFIPLNKIYSWMKPTLSGVPPWIRSFDTSSFSAIASGTKLSYIQLFNALTLGLQVEHKITT